MPEPPDSQPRHWATEPKKFGKPRSGIQWREPANRRDEVRCLAAQYQHTIAVFIRLDAKRRGQNLAEIAALLDTMDYHGLMARLRGQRTMTLTDITDLTSVFGTFLILEQRFAQGYRAVPAGPGGILKTHAEWLKRRRPAETT